VKTLFWDYWEFQRYSRRNWKL